jgi:hypothetical protein
VPPSSTLTDGDNAQQRYAGDSRAGQGARDAPGRGPRENGDDGQKDQVQAGKQVDLLNVTVGLYHAIRVPASST